MSSLLHHSYCSSSSPLTSRSSLKLNFLPSSRIPASQNAVVSKAALFPPLTFLFIYLFIKLHTLSSSFIFQRCNLVEPLKYENGKPYTPYLSSTTTDQATATTTTTTTPSISHSENAHDTRLRIFSGTANPALSQVNIHFLFSICSIHVIKMI